MKKNLIKSINACTIVCLLLVCTAVPSFASITAHGYSFEDPWELTKTATDASLTYGYNEVLINEDYAYAFAGWDTDGPQAYIYNGSGAHYGYKNPANTYSNLEVRHSGTEVIYKDLFSYI